MLESAAGGLFANLVTVVLIYGMWRLTKNEKDWWAMVICLICFGTAATIGFAVPH